MNLNKIFGRNVRIYRELTKLSQEELAEKTDISTESISRIETGRQFVKSKTLEKLANALQIPTSNLFNYCDSQNKIDSDKKLELLQFIEAMSESEIEYFLSQVKIYGKLKAKL